MFLTKILKNMLLASILLGSVSFAKINIISDKKTETKQTKQLDTNKKKAKKNTSLKSKQLLVKKNKTVVITSKVIPSKKLEKVKQKKLTKNSVGEKVNNARILHKAKKVYLVNVLRDTIKNLHILKKNRAKMKAAKQTIIQLCSKNSKLDMKFIRSLTMSRQDLRELLSTVLEINSGY